LREQFGVAELTGFGLDAHPQALSAAGAVIHYLRENAARGDRSGEACERADAPGVGALGHLDRVRYYEHHDTLVLDPVSVRNLERLTSRITLGLATPRELVALRKSLGQLPVLKNFVTPPPVGGSELLRRLHEEIDELSDVRERLERAISDEPPALATEPGIIR